MDLVDNPLRRSQIGPKNIISDRLEPFPIYHVNSISTDAEPVSIDYDQFQNEDNVENDRYKFTKIRKDLYPLHHNTHQLDSDDLYRTPLQRKFYYFFEEPRSKWAQLYSFVSLLCVLITITVICIDSLPTVFIIKQVNVRIWLPSDILVVFIFTLEYLGRYYASINKLKFLVHPLNLLNLISIVPFYIQIVHPFSNESYLRFVRILRVTRIIKSLQRMGRISDGFMIATNVFFISAYQIILNLLYLILVMVISSIFIYYVERGEFESYTETWYRTLPDGTKEKSPFQSVFHCFYFSIAAMTTTGYGDDLPITLLGRFLATLTTISGLLVIALTSSIIGINSDLEWSKYQRRESRVNFYAMWKAIDDANVEKLSSKEQTAKADLLEFQNGILVDLIEEIQDRFNEIDPPMYKFKYDNLRVEYNQTIGKLSQLELEIKEYENLGNLDDYEQLDIIKNDE
ncbi:12549_t:CDS:2 [Funneliformis mosseae]|uniref:12549_t:CDS:1 n=1 Tax=Funneliformis mosseae TaxID=27381 RepID=A0A9N8UY95_FUNMO|nr:12549_t:CDS:2 [Funneliformis mosseae]